MKRTKADILAKITTNDQKITALRLKNQQLYAELIKHHCPRKIGDDVLNTGYSFNGRITRIDGIAISLRYSELHWHFAGYVLKKNGTLSKNHITWLEEIV